MDCINTTNIHENTIGKANPASLVKTLAQNLASSMNQDSNGAQQILQAPIFGYPGFALNLAHQVDNRPKIWHPIAIRPNNSNI